MIEGMDRDIGFFLFLVTVWHTVFDQNSVQKKEFLLKKETYKEYYLKLLCP